MVYIYFILIFNKYLLKGVEVICIGYNGLESISLESKLLNYIHYILIFF